MYYAYLGEITLFPYDQIPHGWMSCDGQELDIKNYPYLYDIISNIYGGDGKKTFRLPNLNGRVPVGAGQGIDVNNQPLTKRVVGQTGGEEKVQLTVADMPAHNHELRCSTVQADLAEGEDNVMGSGSLRKPRFQGSDEEDLTDMSPQSLGTVGDGQAHENRQPYLCLKFCIALVGE